MPFKCRLDLFDRINKEVEVGEKLHRKRQRTVGREKDRLVDCETAQPVH